MPEKIVKVELYADFFWWYFFLQNYKMSLRRALVFEKIHLSFYHLKQKDHTLLKHIENYR